MILWAGWTQLAALLAGVIHVAVVLGQLDWGWMI